MFNVVLYQPEIPANTGNIIRLCAVTGAELHLIEPTGFVWDDRRLRRAGLDYREWAAVRRHTDLDACRRILAGRRWFALSTRGRQGYADVRYRPGDVLLFGAESSGLPAAVMMAPWLDGVLRLPMRPGPRSLNLASAVAVTVYEAWRQQGFERAGTIPG